jgi:hypothetical protein
MQQYSAILVDDVTSGWEIQKSKDVPSLGSRAHTIHQSLAVLITMLILLKNAFTRFSFDAYL